MMLRRVSSIVSSQHVLNLRRHLRGLIKLTLSYLSRVQHLLNLRLWITLKGMPELVEPAEQILNVTEWTRHLRHIAASEHVE